MGYKNESTAILLAFFLGSIGFCGIGQLYVGVLGRGLLIFFFGLILFVSSISLLFADLALGGVWTVLFWLISLAGLGFWIWQIFDARAVCRQHNLQARGGL